MNKKNIFSLLLMTLPMLLLTSCLKDQEDTFSEPAAIRMNNYLKNTENLLTSNSNGWVLNYFPDREQSYGGYSYTLKFEGEDVEVRTEIADPEETFVSKYRLVADDGPVLTFDTYNEAMHYFATPSSGAYEAMDGDFEFIILSATAEEIKLKGKRSGNIMYMHPLTMSSEEYQEKLATFKTDLVFDTAAGVINGQNDTLSIYANDRWLDIQTPDTLIEAPFCYDVDGISLYEPVNIGGQSVRVFKYNDEAGTLLAEEDNSISFTGLLIPSIVTSAVGTSISSSNAANTLTYTFNLADKFNYSTTANWITVSASGKNLTINLAANTTGSPRVGQIVVETQGIKAYISVTQIEVGDLVGNFTMTGKDSDGADIAFDTKITANGGNSYTLVFNYVYRNTYPQTFQMTWNSTENRFEFQSGQAMGTVSSYYSWLVFMDPTASYWTSNSTSYTGYLIPSIGTDGKAVLSLGGTFSSYSIGVLSICVSTATSIADAANLLGYYDTFSNVAFVKN